MKPEGILLDLGMMGYREALDIQKDLWDKRVKKLQPDTILFVEHPHTITLGRRGNRSNLKASAAMLDGLSIPVVHVERGGDITYHGPGQAVVYPILQLTEQGLNISRFVGKLEELVIRVLGDFGIKGERSPHGRGVWVGEQKIASVGIAVSKWVTFHGLALNANTDLKYFDLIDACGLGRKTTSMAGLIGMEISPTMLHESFAAHIIELFDNNSWRWESPTEIGATE